jgi:predicted  nucleic acid-binding Zn-ribbon protein
METIDGLTEEKAESEREAATLLDLSEADKALYVVKELEMQISHAKKDLASLREDIAEVQSKIDKVEEKLGV